MAFSLGNFVGNLGDTMINTVKGTVNGMVSGLTGSASAVQNSAPTFSNIFGGNELTANELRDLQREEREAQWAFATSSAEKANQFSAEQAALNRQWQEQMSNTAYQRAVSDMKAAGLNPALLYNNMSGATTPAGSSAAGQMAQGTQASYSDVTATDRGTSIVQSVISVAGSALAAWVLRGGVGKPFTVKGFG